MVARSTARILKISKIKKDKLDINKNDYLSNIPKDVLNTILDFVAHNTKNLNAIADISKTNRLLYHLVNNYKTPYELKVDDQHKPLTFHEVKEHQLRLAEINALISKNQPDQLKEYLKSVRTIEPEMLISNNLVKYVCLVLAPIIGWSIGKSGIDWYSSLLFSFASFPFASLHFLDSNLYSNSHIASVMDDLYQVCSNLPTIALQLVMPIIGMCTLINSISPDPLISLFLSIILTVIVPFNLDNKLRNNRSPTLLDHILHAFLETPTVEPSKMMMLSGASAAISNVMYNGMSGASNISMFSDILPGGLLGGAIGGYLGASVTTAIGQIVSGVSYITNYSKRAFFKPRSEAALSQIDEMSKEKEQHIVKRIG